MGITICTSKANQFSRLHEDADPRPAPSLEPRKSSSRNSNCLVDKLSDSTLRRYAFSGILGIGKFSRVYLAMTKDSLREAVAVKVTPHHMLKCPKSFHAREVNALRDLRHPCVVEIRDAFVDEYNNIIITEHCAGGTTLDQMERKPLCEGDLVYLALQLIEAVEYAHAKNYVHRDIQPKNILYVDTGREQCVLSGFSFAMHVHDNETYTQRAGTIFFMAPELAPSDHKIRRSGWILKACDVWAVGVSLFYLATGRYPFGNGRMTNQDIWNCIRNADPNTLDFGPDWSNGFKDFVRECLRRDPGQRITMSEARVHGWILGADEEEM